MLILRIWNFFIGYLVIQVDGLSLEKFINLTVSKGILLWKIDRTNYTSLKACISIKDFRRIHPILKTVHCRVKIIDKRGVPFLAFRFRNRKMLFVGMTAFLIILYSLSSFIWVVEVEGTEKIDPQRITKTLKEVGIEPGIFKRSINVNVIENRMMIKVPELAWIGIQLKGTKAIVRVVEAVQPPPIVDRDTPCNIVASKDGIISRMIVLDGEAAVKLGDTVKQGQLLVSGVIDHSDTSSGVRYVHSMGQIIARTWYEGRGYVSENELIHTRTGRIATCKYLEIGSRLIEYQKEEIPFAKYEMVEKRQPFFGKERFFPVDMVVKEYHEIEDLPASMQTKMRKEKAAEMAWEDIRKKIPSGAKVIDKTLKYDMIEGEGITAVMYVEALEDIALQETFTTP